MDAVAAKICSVCGIDCSAKKRAKDANGRYICADCLERAREAKVAKEGKPVVVATGPIVPKKVSAAPAMLPNGVDPIMDNLVAGSKALHQVACTQCAYPMDREAKICTHCGFNTLSGKVMKTAVYKAPKEVKASSGAASAVVSASTAVIGGALGGAIGSAIGASIWCAVAYYTHYEVGYVACAVGILAGVGTVIGARGATNWVTAIYATVMAAVGVLLGRYFAVSLILDELGLGNTPASEWFFETFGLWDVLWAFLALPTAFKIGGGIAGD